MINYKVSLIIPCRNDHLNIFERTLLSIEKQSVQPSEIIIIDSSDNDSIQELINEHKSTIPIIYKKIGPSFAGFSTNFGISISKFHLIALLDTKTAPKSNWLENYINYMRIENVDVVFGSTVFSYSSSFQRAVRATTYGNISHQTVPGTLLAKNVAVNTKFLEDVRAAYDRSF